MQRNDVNKKIKEKNISSSSYMRFIELLSFFSINEDDIFEIYAENDKELKNEYKHDFNYKLIEHEKNYNGIKKYYDVLVRIFENNNVSYDEKISKHMKKAEKKIIEDIKSDSYKILMQYDEFKKFFKEILDDIQDDLKIYSNSDGQIPLYLPIAIELQNYGIYFNNYQVFTDIYFKEYDSSNIKKLKECICNFIDEKIEQDKNYINIFSSFRMNWKIICNLFEDAKCISYLSSLCYFSKELLTKIYPNFENEEILDGRRVLNNAKKYYYFLEYKYDKKSRVSVKTLKKFFQTQVEENPKYVENCMLFLKRLQLPQKIQNTLKNFLIMFVRYNV